MSPEMAAVVAALRARPTSSDSVQRRRSEFSPGTELFALPEDVRATKVTADGVPVWWLNAPTSLSHRVIVFVHGGAWALGGLRSHGELAARIGRAAHARVLLPEYRLAPEHPYPAAVVDVLTVWDWLQTQLPAGAEVALVGDSAGANLLAELLLLTRDSGRPTAVAGVLLSPVTDLTGSGRSMLDNADVDVMFTADQLHEQVRRYLGDFVPLAARVSPLFARLDQLPPLFVQTSDTELLYDDSIRFCRSVTAAGGHAELAETAGMPHVFAAMHGTPEATAATERIAGFLRRWWQ